MDYLQYLETLTNKYGNKFKVLNLIINGLPSIQTYGDWECYKDEGFKPYYKWITFNTIM